ncbi:hypothetical protein D9M70_624490 [compost metagenome]
MSASRVAMSSSTRDGGATASTSKVVPGATPPIWATVPVSGLITSSAADASSVRPSLSGVMASVSPTLGTQTPV